MQYIKQIFFLPYHYLSQVNFLISHIRKDFNVIKVEGPKIRLKGKSEERHIENCSLLILGIIES